MTTSKLIAAATAIASLTVALGWWTALFADASESPARIILVAAATIGTVALTGAVAAARARRAVGTGLLLAVAALASPTSFAYLPNLIVLALAATIVAVARRGDHAGGASSQH